jgi:hypothetical protein
MAARVGPSGVRLARLSSPVVRNSLDKSMYPANVGTVSLSLHDLSYYQALLSNEPNFSEKSLCDIFTLSAENGTGHWNLKVDDDRLTRLLPSYHSPASSSSNGVTHVIFCTLTQQPGSNFGHRLSLSRYGARKLLEELHVNPHFTPLMLGQPDYWAPLSAQSGDQKSAVSRFEYICQHPRWNLHAKQEPCSVYMSYDPCSKNTTYIVASGLDEEFVGRVKARLNENFCEGQLIAGSVGCSKQGSPFLLHAMLAHESFKDSISIITNLRYRLYDQLDAVKKYENLTDRAKLKELTSELHGISQDADSLLASAEMGIMVADGMHIALVRKLRMEADNGDEMEISDTIDYLKQSLEAQKRWLLSYKSRKDIAMNLVFNLVTQQDSQTNTSIARDTKDDSANMKIIAVLTMLFLPATAVSSVFGMAMFQPSQADGRIRVAANWWLFPAITLPLTVFTILLWWLWYPLQSFFTALSKHCSQTAREAQNDHEIRYTRRLSLHRIIPKLKRGTSSLSGSSGLQR